MNSFDVIIIGAGPAGLMCAITCADSGLRVCLLEKNRETGRKLLIAGSGKCNITHSGTVESFLDKYGDAGRFVKPALFSYTNDDLKGFFLERNVPLVEMEGGKIFPASLISRDVLECLVSECVSSGVVIIKSHGVNKVAHNENLFIAETGDGVYTGRYLVICTGGKSYPSTGTTGDGYEFARELGHHIVEPSPALTSVVVRDYEFKTCAGISFQNAAIEINRKGRKVLRRTGALLFTHGGLSGPVILDSSRYICKDDGIRVNLTGFESSDDFEQDFMSRCRDHGRKSVGNIITAYGIPERIVERICEISGIDPALKASQLDRETRSRITGAFCSFHFHVQEKDGFNEAMVTSGGVSKDEVNARTMESRIVPSLYFAGEVLDVDGDTGGYNIQFAFSSGVLAGRSILKKACG